jgi:hypothetical protein
MPVVRAPWTSASFLLYLGGITILFASVWLLTTLAEDYRDAAFVGWSALVLAFLTAGAFAFRRMEQPLVAGLLAVSAVIALVVFLGALEEWFGWLPGNDEGLFEGFRVRFLLLPLLVGVAAAYALRIFRFPLLVAVLAAAGWFFVTDLVSGGGDWSAVVTIMFGLILLGVALGVDAGPREYGFWLHVAAGLTIGGGLLWLFHSSDWNLILVAFVGLVYVALADRFVRSSWAVLGAWGLLQTTTHFAAKWASADFFPFFYFFPFSFLTLGDGGYDEDPGHLWAGPVAFGVLAFVFIAIGLFLVQRRPALPPAAA